MFSVLPFGSASAPYVFTMSNTEGPSLTLEGTGICIFTYLDDGAGTAKTLQSVRAASKRFKEDIAASGYVAYPDKCCWEPT